MVNLITLIVNKLAANIYSIREAELINILSNFNL